MRAGIQPCSLAVALHPRSHGLAEAIVHVGMDIQSSWNNCMRWFKIENEEKTAIH